MIARLAGKLPAVLRRGRVRPLGLDRYGVRLRVEGGGADGGDDHDVRLPFPEPVHDITGLGRAIRLLMGCPFVNGLRARGLPQRPFSASLLHAPSRELACAKPPSGQGETQSPWYGEGRSATLAATLHGTSSSFWASPTGPSARANVWNERRSNAAPSRCWVSARARSHSRSPIL